MGGDRIRRLREKTELETYGDAVAMRQREDRRCAAKTSHEPLSEQLAKRAFTRSKMDSTRLT